MSLFVSFLKDFGHSGKEAKRFTWMYLIGYVVVALIFIGCSIAFIYAPLNDEIANRQTTNLVTTAQASANALSKTVNASEFVLSATHSTDLRMTIIDSDGKVIADSEVDPSTMANHSDREEVTEAIHGEIGIAQRTSATDSKNWLYVAVPASYNDEQVVVRVSEPSTAFSMITQNAQTTSLIFIVTGCLVVLIVALIAFKKSHAPIKKFDQVRSDFVANASHELKTPVAGIRLLSEAIRDAAEIEDKKSLNLFIDRLDNEAERLQRLVIDLLDLSRLEETPDPDKRPRTDVHSALVTSFMAHKGGAEDKHLDLVLDDRSAAGDDCYADMEPSDASLVFDNLIENAIMYTDEGSILVTFEPRAHEIAVTVQDTGIGIPQADQSRIFERFYRVDKARSREVGGTGLGLSLVRHAVERSNGRVSVKSNPGEGSQFTVVFPRSKR